MFLILAQTQRTLAGLGAVLLGAGSLLSGWAALRKARDEHLEAERRHKHENNVEQSVDGS